MNKHIYIISVLIAGLLFFSCSNTPEGEPARQHEEGKHQEEGGHSDHEEEEGQNVHLSPEQVQALGIELGTVPTRAMSNLIKASGRLEVPPQNEATVTAILGANIASIEVIEGQDVRKGQVLAYLYHPSIIELQRSYVEAYYNQKYLKQEFERQERLYKEEVGAGKVFQKTQSAYQVAKATSKSYESQLKQLGMNPNRVKETDFYEKIPVRAPIKGSITKVNVQTGQYVNPELDMFEVVNTHHIHVDFMVFEKDVHHIEKGQRIRLRVESMPNRELYANIYSVGKKFEPEPKAVHVHAELENKTGKLIPGMYVQGEVMTDSVSSLALPESAVIREGDNYLAFVAKEEKSAEKVEWMFTALRVTVGEPVDGWIAIQFLDPPPVGAQFALNNAYYLLAELKKGEGGHHHH